jgi:trimeric autotransporter adhesin
MRQEGRGLHCGDEQLQPAALVWRQNHRPRRHALPMLRGSTLGRASLALALALLWASPAAADMTIGGACSGGAGSPQAANGNNVWCNGSTWQYPAYWFGSTSTGCSSATAGLVQYTGGVFEGCNGTAWGALETSNSDPLSSITAATTTSSINNGANAITWNWNTLTTQSALTFGSSSMTTGSLLALSDTNTVGASKVLNVSNSSYDVSAYAIYGLNNSTTGNGAGVTGVTQSTGGDGILGYATAPGNTASAGFFADTSTTGSNYAIYTADWSTSGYGGYFSDTATTGTNYGIYATNASASGYGGYFANTSTGWALGATGTAYFNGNVGIGTATPKGPFTVCCSAASNGYLTVANNVTLPDTTTGIQLLTLSSDSAADNTLNMSVDTGENAYIYTNPNTDLFLDAGLGAGGCCNEVWIGWNTANNVQIGHPGSNSVTVDSNNIELAGSVGIDNASPGALLDIGVAGTTTGTMRLEGKTSGYVQLSPSAAAGSWTMTLPTGAGTTGYVLSTDGSGNTSWISNAGTASTAMSGITAATTTHAIDSSNWAQTWRWGTLTTQNALALQTSSMTTGNLLTLDVLSTNNSAGTALNIIEDQTGAGQAVYVSSATTTSGIGIEAQLTTTANTGETIYASNATTTNGITIMGENTAAGNIGEAVIGKNDTTSSGIGVEGILSGTGNTGFAGYFTNSSATGTNYSVYATNASASGYGGYFTNSGAGWALATTGTSYFNGNVGIGTTSPGRQLDIENAGSGPQLRLGMTGYNSWDISGLYNTTNADLIFAMNGEKFRVNANGELCLGYTTTNCAGSNSLVASGNVGIGTSSPSALLAVAGHIDTHQTAPSSLTAGCGSAATIVGTDTAMQITTTGSGLSTTCGATFNTKWVDAPTCIAQRYNANVVTYLSSVTTSAFVVTSASAFTAGAQFSVTVDEKLRRAAGICAAVSAGAAPGPGAGAADGRGRTCGAEVSGRSAGQAQAVG